MTKQKKELIKHYKKFKDMSKEKKIEILGNIQHLITLGMVNHVYDKGNMLKEAQDGINLLWIIQEELGGQKVTS